MTSRPESYEPRDDTIQPVNFPASPKQVRQNGKRNSESSSPPPSGGETGNQAVLRASSLTKNGTDPRPSRKRKKNDQYTNDGSETETSQEEVDRGSPPRKKPRGSDSVEMNISVETCGSNEHEYKCEIGQEVLARWSDGLFYLGRVSKLHRVSEQCLVIYEDKSSFWAMYKDLQNVPSKPSTIDEMVCNHCQEGDSDQPNEIVICDNCGIGYHQKCHKPVIDESVLDSRESWHCRLCVFVSAIKKGGAQRKGANAKLFSKIKLSLPYEPSSLLWDEDHLSNTQRCYCYCGGPGEWRMKMLQCSRCDQWFHEACLQCLDYPLLYGDRRYVFVCGVCNFGNEYIQRVPLNWIDIIQLALFNLVIVEGESWFDVQTICTWIKQNLALLQLEETFHTFTAATWRFHVLRHISKHRQFVNGPKFTYGLRERAPPSRLEVVLEPGVLDDQIVKEAIEAARNAKKNSHKAKVTRRRRSKMRLSLPVQDDVIKPKPRLAKVKKSLSTTSLYRSDDAAESTVTSGTDTDVDITTVDEESTSTAAEDVAGRKLDDNNNNYSDAYSERKPDDDKGFLNRFIPDLASFEGPRHPFKTVLEKEEELRVERKKARILAHYGAEYVSSYLPANNFLTPEEEKKRRSLHTVEKFQRKRGKRSAEDKKLLEEAETVLGLTGSGRRKRRRVESLAREMRNKGQVATKEKLRKGEGFEIKAKRVLPDGQVQYLMAWEGLQ